MSADFVNLAMLAVHHTSRQVDMASLYCLAEKNAQTMGSKSLRVTMEETNMATIGKLSDLQLIYVFTLGIPIIMLA